MVPKRLHTFSGEIKIIGIVLLVFSITVSCTDHETGDRNTGVINESMNSSKDETVSETVIEFKESNTFISDLLPVRGRNLTDTRYGNFSVLLPLEDTVVSREQVFTYDVERNGYVASYNLVNPITDSISLSFVGYPYFYLIDNKIMIDYSEGITPNMRMPIFKTGDFYVSTFQPPRKRERMIIYSSDLIDWRQSGVIHPEAPILLYEQNEVLFALAGRQIWDVSDPRHARLSQELKYTVMPPELPIRSGSIYVQDILYCFNIKNYLVMSITIAAEEQSGGEYFTTIDLNDFSRKSVEVNEDINLYRSNYKAVKREDGWKIYHIGRDPANGIIVLDPFALDGPAIIERLPGVNLP